MSRVLKQLLYGIGYCSVVGLLILGGYRLAVPAPTCTDGVQNGSEEGVDCGAAACGVLCHPVLIPLSVPTPLIVPAGTGHDVVAFLENTNVQYSATRVEYLLTVRDASQAVLATRRGNTYVNPLTTQALVFPFPGFVDAPASVQLQFDAARVEWNALRSGAVDEVEFTVRNEQLAFASASVQYVATITNKSRFDFNEVDVIVFLHDAQGNVVSANSTIIRTFRAGELRDVSLAWPFGVPNATRARVQIGTNVLSNENYLREYGAQEQFQGF